MQNEAIYQILNSRDDWEITHIPILAYKDKDPLASGRSYDLTLIDAHSLSGNPSNDIHSILSWKTSDNIVLMHNGQSKEFLDEVLNSGVKRALSINLDTEDFVTELSKYATPRR